MTLRLLLLGTLTLWAGPNGHAQVRYAACQRLVVRDGPLLEKLTARLRRTGVSTFLVYQTTLRTKPSGGSARSEDITFLAWATATAAYARLLTADTLYQPVQISAALFAYSHRFACGVLPAECTLQFVPPLFTFLTPDFVGYHAPTATFFFEGVPAISYVGRPARDLARAHWLDLLRAALLPLRATSQPEAPYRRPPIEELATYQPYLFRRAR